MTRTEMLAIMKRLDARANALLLSGADDSGLFIGMADVMADFKMLLDSPHKHEIEANAARFPGLHYYARVLSGIAENIANGSIKVPR